MLKCFARYATSLATNSALLLALSISTVGCSGDESDPTDPLVGKWVGASSTDDGNCTPAATFTGTVYEFEIICRLTGGDYGVEAEIGNYTTKDDVLSVVPTAASCRVDREHAAGTFSYTVEGDSLRLVTAARTIVLQRLTSDPHSVNSGGAPVTTTYGCANSRNFVESSIEKL